MSSPKERHYWSQLRAAITAGQWRSEFPVKAYNGSALSWSELFRKFKKHCRGFEDVAVVAEQTRLLALLLGSKYKDDDENSEVEDTSAPNSEGGSSRKGRLGKVDLEEECVLLPERVEEAKVGYDTIQSLQSSRFDVSSTFCLLARCHHNPVDIDNTLCTCLLCICAWKPQRLPTASIQSSRVTPISKPYTQ